MNAAFGQVWDEWRRVTRFMQSGKIAFEREAALWASLQMESKDTTVLSVPSSGGQYQLTISDHEATVSNQETLFAAALVQSCAIAEAVVPELLGGLKAEGGIEAWGLKCLDANGADWTKVLGGQELVVTAFVTRNTWAHGSRTLDAAGVARLNAAGKGAAMVGDPIDLSYRAVSSYRDGIRSHLRLSGVRAQ